MIRKIFTSCLTLIVLFIHLEKTYASDRVVLLSVPSDIWYKRVYLIAIKKSWMDYGNFTVQIGDGGQLVYHFPNWYHGKYDPTLYYKDISGDRLEDVIVVLNNDKASIGTPLKDIHILNQIQDPYLRYEESPVEPIDLTFSRLVKLEKQGNFVTILADKKEYKIDISKYNFTNARKPFSDIDAIEYSIESGILIGTVSINVVRDNSVYGGLLGHLAIKYFWNGKMYKAKSITFKQNELEARLNPSVTIYKCIE